MWTHLKKVKRPSAVSCSNPNPDKAEEMCFDTKKDSEYSGLEARMWKPFIKKMETISPPVNRSTLFASEDCPRFFGRRTRRLYAAKSTPIKTNRVKKSCEKMKRE
jgi:hypothetical protein